MTAGEHARAQYEPTAHDPDITDEPEAGYPPGAQAVWAGHGVILADPEPEAEL